MKMARSIAYFDLRSGISGDMLLGSLIDLGADPKRLNEVIDELGLENVHVEIEEKTDILTGKNVDIVFKEEEHTHRRLADILDKVEESDLDEWIKEKSIEAFTKLGKVESKIHDEAFEDIELHEVGMIDSILDIVGSIALFEDLDIEKAYSSTVTLGSGTVECQHGELQVPVPATTALLKGWKINRSDREGEMTTPTGAALISTLTIQERPPDMELEEVGVGFGDSTFEEGPPNALRLFLGKTSNLDEAIEELRFYIDDQDPETLSYALERIREKAVDVYTTNGQGKKGRQGREVTVLCSQEDIEKVVDTIFSETSTLGVRTSTMRRYVADREIREVETRWGPVKIKVSRERISPEFEDCKRIAEENDVPLKKVYEEVRKNLEQ